MILIYVSLQNYSNTLSILIQLYAMANNLCDNATQASFLFSHCLLLGREDWEEDLEAVLSMEQSFHDVFLLNDTYLCLRQAWEQIPFKLCNAQPQFLWYGLRSTSLSCIDMLPS